MTFLLGDKCPADVNEDPNFEADYWQTAFSELEKQLIHLTFYPTLHFPDAVKQFCPEMPFKINILGQVVREFVHTVQEKSVLQLGVQFAYEPQGVPLKNDEFVNWRYSRYIKDNPALKEAHTHLSQLYGFLENQSLTSGANTRRQRRPGEGEAPCCVARPVTQLVAPWMSSSVPVVGTVPFPARPMCGTPERVDDGVSGDDKESS